MLFFLDGLKKLIEAVEAEGGVSIRFESWGGGTHAFASIQFLDRNGAAGDSVFLLRTEGGSTVVERQFRVEL